MLSYAAEEGAASCCRHERVSVERLWAVYAGLSRADHKRLAKILYHESVRLAGEACYLHWYAVKLFLTRYTEQDEATKVSKA